MNHNDIKSIYLDMCSLRRPYDDLSIMRNQLEATAVDLIINAVHDERFVMYWSPVHEDEIAGMKNVSEKEEVYMVLYALGKPAATLIDIQQAQKRAEFLSHRRFGLADAAHVAYAEACGCAFICCDDELLKLCRKWLVKIWFGTPIDFCKQEGLI